jgi:hypothetical protein
MTQRNTEENQIKTAGPNRLVRNLRSTRRILRIVIQRTQRSSLSRPTIVKMLFSCEDFFCFSFVPFVAPLYEVGFCLPLCSSVSSVVSICFAFGYGWAALWLIGSFTAWARWALPSLRSSDRRSPLCRRAGFARSQMDSLPGHSVQT